MKKINIVELLKDCPKGMELDCSMYDNLYFDCIREHPIYPIVCYTIDSKGEENKITFDWYGKYAQIDTAKCVIFPKGKTTWEGFVPPCKFKEGDVVVCNYGNIHLLHTEDSSYCAFRKRWNNKLDPTTTTSVKVVRLATEEEKQILFDAIKENGYKWNAETKTLEITRLNFKVGDWIIRNNKYTGIPVKVIEFNGYYSCELNGEVVNFTLNDVHNNFHLWTIQDAKDGDVLVDKDNNIGIFQKFEGIYWYSYIYLGCDGELRGFTIGGSHKQTDVYPATKEQRDLLFQKIKEAGYKWNPETKTLEKLNIPKEEPIEDKGNISDGYHTFNELYEYRLLYNASMFNELAKQGLYDVHKSKKHSDGTIPFGDENWFIVQAELPTGQISNHYEMKDWDLFQVPVKEKANPYDGHTPQDVAKRLRMFLTSDKLIEPKFKVGDKVRFSDSNTPFTISRIWWDNNASELICTLEEQDIDVSSVDLQPYKEETMEEKGTLVEIDLTREMCVADEVEVILGDYEFVLKDGKTYFAKKKPQYPKTYEECAQILLERASVRNDIGHKGDLLIALQRLLVCRDAYWKIAGEQMGLGEPWKPDWLNTEQDKFVLYTHNNSICSNCFSLGNNILAFPTAKMRDAFYENFKDLIEDCKELL